MKVWITIIFGIFLLGWVGYDIYIGEVGTKGGTKTIDEHPFEFWFHCIIVIALVIGAILHAIYEKRVKLRK